MNIYKLLRYRNDIKAIAKGRAPQRLVRRTVYHHAFRAAGMICRALGVSK